MIRYIFSVSYFGSLPFRAFSHSPISHLPMKMTLDCGDAEGSENVKYCYCNHGLQRYYIGGVKK